MARRGEPRRNAADTMHFASDPAIGKARGRD
jgi:hypothetical protein